MKTTHFTNKNINLKSAFLIILIFSFFIPKIVYSQTAPHAFFDASNYSYIDFGKASSLTSYSTLSTSNKLTVSMWVKWESKSNPGVGQWANLFSMADSSASQTDGVFWIQHNSSNSKFEVSLHTISKTTLLSTTTPIEGQWYHIAFVYDGSLGGSNLKLYINGVLEASSNKMGNIRSFPSKAKLNMGRWLNSNNNGGFNGSIDEVSVWNSALSAAQIISLKNDAESVTGLSYNASGLIAYYDFTGKTATDLTSNSADGIPARNVVFWDTDSKEPFVYLTASDVRFCSGANIDFKANARNNSSQSYYQFFVNGISQQNSSSSNFSSNSLVNNDKIYTQLFSVPSDRGTLDSLFSIGSGFNNNVFTIASQSDGKIIVGGEFTTYKSNTANYLVRLNSDGSIDNTFITGSSFNGIVQAVKIQSDGKIIVVGNFTSYNGTLTNGVIRLNSDGSIDSGFNYGSGFNNTPFAIAIQSDGKIIIGGQFTTYNGVTTNRIVRLDSDGNRDATFSIGSGFNNIVYAIEIQTNGKIVIGGTFTLFNAVTSNRIARLNSNGTMDAMFLTGTGMDKIVYALAIQKDGKIIAGGTFTTVNDVPNNRIIRLNTDGTTDNSFTIGTGFNGTVRSINTQLDDYILIGGQFTTYNSKTQNRITRLYPSGSIDTLFRSGTGFDNNVYTCSYSTNGKIYSGGIFSTFNSKSSSSIVRLNNASDSKSIINSDTVIVEVRVNTTNVSVDQSNIQFCEGSTATINATGAETYVWSNGLGTGSILIYTPINTTTVTVTGYSSDGCFSSATTHIIVDKIPVVDIWPKNLSVCSQQNLTIYASGAQSYEWSHGLGSGSSKTVNPVNSTTYTITATGSNACTSTKQVAVVADKIDISLESTDTSICIDQPVTFTLNSQKAGPGTMYNFFVNGISVQNSTSNSYFSNSLADDDEIYCEVLAQPISNGSIDTSFNIGTGFGSAVRTLAYQTNGKIIVGGEFNSYKSSTANYIIRLNSDGSVDNSFVTGTGFNDFVYSVKIQNDGKIIVVGNFTQYNGVSVNRIVRLNIDGSIDSGFQTGTGFNNNVYAIAIQGDGKIIVGGQFTSYNGISSNRIVRLNTNGTIDMDYTIGIGFDNIVYAIEIQLDGKAIIGGSFTSYSSVPINRLTRLNSNGTMDAMFNTGYGFNKEVFAISIQNDSKIIIGGTFTLVDSVATNRIVRLNSNGNTDNTFSVGAGLNGTVRSLIVLSDGNVIVAGQFSTYNNLSANKIVRIQENGLKDPTFTSGDPNNNIYALSYSSTSDIFIGGAFTNYESKSINSLALLKNSCCFDITYTSTSIIIQVNSIQANTVLNISDSTICNGDTIQLVASGAISYEWSDGYGTGSIKIISPTTSDTISVIGLTADGCLGYDEAIINVVNHPNLTIIPENPSICEGNNITIKVKGADSYIWSDGVGSGDQKTLSPTSTKTYTVTGSILGCTSTQDITVEVFKTSMLLESNSPITCQGDTVKFTASPPNSGFSNTYNFTINGVSAQNTTSNILATTSLQNNDTVQCQTNSVFLESGIIDTTFLIGNGFNGVVRQIIQQPDGKYIAVGQFTSYQGVVYNRIIRLNINGTIDNDFIIGSGFNDLVRNISLQSDGKILVVGDFLQYNGIVVNRIVRLNVDGSLDNTFNTGTGFNSRAYIIKPLNTGKILVSGAFTAFNGVPKPRLIRLNSNGSLDTEFDIGTGFPNGNVNELFIQNDDKIIAAGSFIGFNGNSAISRIVRLNSNGDLDNTFTIGSGFDDAPIKILQQNDEKLIFVGGFTTYNDSLRSRIIRLNIDGTLDETFSTGLGFNDLVYDIVSQPDNKYIICGAFVSYDGSSKNRLVRINNDGSIDNSFTIGDGFNADGRALCLNSDGNILVGGVFSTYNSISANNLVLLKNAFCYESSLTSNTIITSVKPKPTISIAVSQNPICLSNSTTITASSLDNINTWSWNSGQNTAQINVSPIENTTYTISATSSNGCVNHNQITVNLLPSPNFWITPPIYSSCNGNSVSLSAFGAQSYEWSNGLGSGNLKTVNPTETTTYTVTASGSNSCTSSKNITVSVSKFDVSLTSSDTTFCFGKSVTFTASSPQSNATSEYDFKVNGISVQKSTSNIYTSSTLNNGDIVSCLFTQNVIGNGLIYSGINIGSGLNGTAKVIVRQNDGKFIVGGTFTNYNGSAALNIVRINSDGSIDNTFSTGTGFDAEVRAIKVQPNGKIIIGGAFTLYNGTSVNRIVQLNENGSVDNSFNIGTGFNNNINAIIIQPDGKALIAGEFTTYKGITSNRIVRLDQSGNIDATFTIGTGFNNFIYALEMQNDGKIIVGGNFTSFNGTSINRIARLNSSGTIDALFTVGSGANNTVSAISIQSDAKIIIGGSFTTYNGTSINRIVRLNSTGTIDNSYSVGTGFNNNILWLSRLPNDDVFVAGQFTTYKGLTANRIIRLDSDGNKDSQFGGTGADNTINSIELTSDWKAVLVGAFTNYNGSAQNRITSAQNTICYDSQTLSSSITVSVNPNTTNIQINPSSAQICNGNSVTLTASGADNYTWSHTLGTGAVKNPTPSTTTTYTVTGTNNDGCFSTKTVTVTVIPIPETLINTSSPIICDGANVTLTASGADSYEWSNGLGSGNEKSVNPTTNTTYTVTGTNSGMCSASNQITITNHKTTVSLSSNALNVCGNQTVTFTATATNAGSASTYKFKVNGAVVQNTTSNTYITSTLTSNDTVDCELIAVPDNMGVLDASLNIGTGFNGTIYQVVRQSDGKYIVAGDFTSYKGVSINRIVRINADGTVDNSFAVGSGFNGAVRTMIIQSNNKTIIGGSFTTYKGITVNRIVRLNTDGSIDNSFAIGSGFNDVVYSMAFQTDGKIVVAGQFTSYNGTGRNRIIRLNADGSIESSFSIGTGFNNNYVSKIVVQADGKIIAVGSFTSYKGVTVNRIIRLNSDGSQDVTFALGTGFNNVANTIAIQIDGKYIVGGSFTTYNGTTRNRIIRINSNGTIDATYGIGTGFDNNVFDINIQSDNKAIIAGQYTNYAGNTRNGIVRLFENGSIDNNFNIGTGYNAPSRNILIQPNGSVLIVGEFTTYKGSGINRMTLLKNTLCYEGGVYSNQLTSVVKSNPTLTVSATPNTVCIAQEATINASSNIPINTWAWSSGQTTPQFVVTPVSTQTYTVTATSTQGCTSTSQTQVTVNLSALPNAQITSEKNSICLGNFMTLVASGGDSYEWSNGLGNNDSIVVSPITSTTYTVTVTSASGCTSTASKLITINSNPTPGISGTTSICVGQNTTLTGTGGDSYLWSNGATSPSINVSPGSSTAYSVTVTSILGCTSTTSQIVNVNSLPITSMSGTYLICSGQSTTLTANGGISYLWSTGATTQSIVVTPASNTSYSVTATNVSGCSGSVSQVITVMEYPIAAISGNTGVCAGQSTILTASGGSIYLWNNGATAASITVSPITSTTYNVTVTNAAGCSSTASQLVSVNSFLTAGITGTDTICAGQSTILTGTGGDTYEWSDGSTTSSITVSPSSTTTYFVTASTASGCTGTTSKTITVSSNLSASISGESSICSGKNTTLTVTGSGTYLWSTGQVSTSISVSPASTSTYGVTVTNASGCTGSASHEITVLSTPNASISGLNIVCEGQSTNLTASGGNSYFWNTGSSSTSITISPNSTTTYTVTVTGASGCTNTASLLVTVISNIPVSISGESTICSGNSTTLTATGEGNYLWSTGQTTASINVSPVSTTTYSVTVTNLGGCTGSASHELTVLTKPSVSISGLNAICEGQSSLLTATGGNSYLWSTTEITSSITVTPLINTTYTVTATALNGCTSTANQLINVSTNIAINISPKDAYICPGESINLSVLGADTYVWSHSLGTNSTVTVQPTVNTTYSVTGTSSGCQGTAQVTVSILTGPKLVLSSDINNVCNGVPVVFTATPKYVKNSPNIKFYINGGIVQNSTSTTYTTSSLNNGDVVYSEMDNVEQSQGILDEDFNAPISSNNSIINGLVRTLARQSDNKIIIGGAFSQINNNSYARLARINVDGSLDTLFNIGSGFNNTIYSVAIQSDQKIIAAGQFTSVRGIVKNRIVRLNTDGTTDESFAIGKGFNNTVYSVVIQPNGKIIVAGSFTTYNNIACNRIVRLNEDGTIDTGFNIGTGFDNIVYSVALQSNGKVVVGGNFTTFNGVAASKIIRLNSNGLMDAMFTTGSGMNNVVYSLSIQPDGKIIAGGQFTTFNSTSRNRIVRLLSTGLIDATFVPGTGFNNIVYAIDIQSDGKIIAGGQFTTFNNTSSNYVARINSDGSLDGNLSIGTGFNSAVYGIEALENNNFYAVGQFTSYNASNKTYLAQVTEVGLVNSEYNTDYGFNNTVQSITTSNDGNIYIGGSFTAYNDNVAGRISVMTIDGNPSSIFISGTGFNNSVNAMVVQPDGKIVVVGAFTSYNNITSNRIIRLNPNGSIDNTFSCSINNIINDVVLQSDGKIIVAGNFSTCNGVSRNKIARLNSDGSVDLLFNPGSGFSSQVRKLSLQTDGKIIAGGEFATFNGITSSRIARLLSNGQIDPSFGVGSGFVGNVQTLVVQSDGKIIVGGIFTSYKGTSVTRIARLNSDGSLDNAFVSGTGFNNSVNSIIVLKNNKYIIAGAFTTYKGSSANRIVKLNFDGSVDTDFEIGVGFNNVVNCLYMLPDGMIMAGGVFNAYQGKTAKRFAKLSNVICNITSATSNSINMIVGQPGCGSKMAQPIINISKLEYCENETSDYFVLNTPISEKITWQKRMNGTEWIDLIASNIPVFSDRNLSVGNWEYRAVINPNTTAEQVSNSITITVDKMPISNYTYSVNETSVHFVTNSEFASTYNWNFGDGSSSTDENPIHNYIKSGEFNVDLQITNGKCRLLKNMSITIIDDKIGTEFIVFPNPSRNGLFNVQCPSNTEMENLKLDVYDSFGKLVYSETTSLKNGMLINLNISDNARGIYFLKLTTNEGVFTKKILYQ